MAIISRKFFVNPFAVSGDRGALPNAAQIDGSVSYTTGYGYDYQLDPATDPSGRDIERLQLNQLMNDVTGSLKQIQVYGVPNFITTSDNDGTAFPYSKNALALYQNGSDISIYQSLADSNATLPTDETKWIKVSLKPAIGFTAGLTATVALANGADVPIIFNDVSDNTGGCYNVATGEFTVKYTGLYDFDIGGQLASIAADTSLVMQVLVNGVAKISSDNTTAAGAPTPSAESSASRKIKLVSGDVVTFIGRQTNTATSTYNLSAGIETYVSCDLCYLI